MSITFIFKELASTASKLYEAKGTDETGKVITMFQVACDDETQLQASAQEAYSLLINPVQPKEQL